MIARVGKKNKGSSGGSGFKYKKRSADQVKKRADQTGGNFDSPVKRGFDMWRPKAGENVIRILPPTWEDFEHYGFDVFMHRFIGSDSSNYICLNKMKGKRCAACDEAKSLKDDGEEDDAKQMAFQKRCWVWVVDRDDKTLTPQVWDMSWSQDRDIAAQSNFKSGKVLLIDHPDDGYDVVVKKSGTGMKTRYTITIDRDPSPISDDDDKQEEILDFITENPIPTVFNFFSNEHIEKKLAGTTEDKDEDLDDDDKPKKKKAGRRDADEDEDEDERPKKKKRKPAEEEDEDEDETPRRKKKRPDPDEDEDEDEDEKPRKKKKRPAEEDEDEDEDERPKKKKRRPDPDEDEDEDDKPKKKKRRPVEEEDEDEDERPKKKKRKPVEEEDEDEDERPKKKKKRVVEEEDDDD